MKKFSLFLLLASVKAISLLETPESTINTQQWAKADKIHNKRAKKEEFELHTSGMSQGQKSDLLHSIANGAQADIDEEEHPSEKPLTEEQVVAARDRTTEEVESQTLELEQKDFSSDDISAFTKMSDQNGQKTFKN